MGLEARKKWDRIGVMHQACVPHTSIPMQSNLTAESEKIPGPAQSTSLLYAGLVEEEFLLNVESRIRP
jgi:hypothetical protein